MAHLKCDVSVVVFSRNLNTLAVKNNVAELISCAKGTDYVYAPGNLMGSLEQ